MKTMSHYVRRIPLACFVLGIIFILPPKGKSQDSTDPTSIIQTAPAPVFASQERMPEDKPFNIAFPEREKETRKTSIQISPNPVTQSANVKIINPSHKVYTLFIYNFIGEVIKKIDNITMREITIERGNLKSGIYFIQLFSRNIRITTSKMIIN